jgi:predicted nuclease with TOPRIM domain
MKKLQEMNADLTEVKSNIKQTQTQVNQLEETNGKNKKQEIATAQNNLKNLNKRHAQLEKEAKTMSEKFLPRWTWKKSAREWL